MIIDISDKVVVVTGSSRGIGSQIIKRMAKENAKVVINYSKSHEDALELYSEITQFNNNCIMYKADVTVETDVRNLCKETINAFGKIDVLINNAGICDDSFIPMMSEKQWKKVIDVNLNGVFICSKVFSREMMRKHNGKIINIASLKGQLGSEGQTNYSASKAGVIGFTKALAKELGNFNISVNAVCPGYIKTDLNKDSKYKSKVSKNMSALDNINCLDDLLDFLVYITSDRFMCVSGRVFNLDSRIL